MYVEKIEIPAFRVLRDVVLEFGGGYEPQIFPLGSKNGGGKSTLLQLVFVLLHCRERYQLQYLRNLLATDSEQGTEPQATLARFTVRLDRDTHILEFLVLSDEFLADKLGPEPPVHGFGTANQKRLLERPKRKGQQNATEQQVNTLAADLERIQNLFLALNYHYVLNYQRSTPTGAAWYALACHVHRHSAEDAGPILDAIANKILLLGPSNQQYLFLAKNRRQALLDPPRHVTEEEYAQYDQDNPPPDSPQIAYVKALVHAESELPGFFAYDWLSVEPLLRLFKQAKDQDFETMVKTGAYGNKYPAVLAQVNDLLFGKKVRPLPDLSGVEFLIADAQGNETPLHPSDLSQGELKRLLIFAWLRANDATDALVLIDEIETSFHPDWQVGIVRDLEDWGPKNQYILATHSYELCQALTPRHVKELEPRLAKSGTTSEEAQRSGSSNG